ncbi:MAG TPA: hypothetical protein PKH39_15230 [Woeseiaceae bacterium]|nr:hypothetical protein [Woeseiaceae bacterium]
MPDFTYFVSGKVYARIYGTTDQFEWPGLVDTVTLAVSQNIIQLPDTTQAGGGVYKEIRRIESVALTLNHRELDPMTLARAIYGAQTAVAAGAIVDEEYTIQLGQFIPLVHPGPYTLVTVTDDAATPVTISADQYVMSGAGITINADATELINDDVIRVSYTHPGYNRVQALTSSPPELEIFFEGINEANGDQPAPTRIHRVRFGPAEDLQLLSTDDFGALSLSGEVLKDLTKTGAGISQYFYTDVVPAA